MSLRSKISVFSKVEPALMIQWQLNPITIWWSLRSWIYIFSKAERGSMIVNIESWRRESNNLETGFWRQTKPKELCWTTNGNKVIIPTIKNALILNFLGFLSQPTAFLGKWKCSVEWLKTSFTLTDYRWAAWLLYCQNPEEINSTSWCHAFFLKQMFQGCF